MPCFPRQFSMRARATEEEKHGGPEMSSPSLLQAQLRPGSVPPRSFKEGIVYVEAPQIKKGKVTLNLVGLWPDPIVLEVT